MPHSSAQCLDPRSLALIADYELLAKRIVDGLFVGLHRGPRHAFSLEYSRHRPYERGDPLKRIDWKLYGKTDHLYIRQYQEETSLQAWMMLDASASMHFKGPAEAVTKWQYATFLAAAFCHLLLEQNDSAGLITFDETLKRVIPPRGSRQHQNLLLKELGQSSGPVKPCGGTHFEKTAALAAALMKRKGLIFYFSDLLAPAPEIERAIHLLSSQGSELYVFHILSGAELEFPYEKYSEFQDMETGEVLRLDPAAYRQAYLRNFSAYLRDIKKFVERREAGYRLVDAREPLNQVLLDFFEKRRLAA